WSHQTHEQTWGVFLPSSRDGFHWNWIDRHAPFMVRGEVGSYYDAGYQDMSGPITHAGKHWLYYGAFSGAHGDKNRLGESRVSVALATLPADRRVGRSPVPTRPLSSRSRSSSGARVCSSTSTLRRRKTAARAIATSMNVSCAPASLISPASAC